MLKSKNILVVEDEVLISFLLEEELIALGANAWMASTVEEALRLTQNVAFAGAILDCNLSGAVVTPVGDRLAGLGVPVLFATGYGEDCDKGRHADAPVFRKPYDIAELMSCLSDLVGTTRA